MNNILLLILSGGFLAGYRTYIFGGLMVLQAIASFLVGDINLAEFIAELPELLGGLGLMSLRAAVANQAASNGKPVAPSA